LPFDDDLERRLRSALFKYDKNPYNPTAVEHWRWEEHKLLLQKEQVRSLINAMFKGEETDDTQYLAKLVIDFEFYNGEGLADYLRDADYLNPTGVANFAHSLMLVMHDHNDVDTMWDLEQMVSAYDEIKSKVKTAGRAMISYAKESIRKLIVVDESNRLDAMLAVDRNPEQLYNMSNFGRYALANPTQLSWDDVEDSEWFEEYENRILMLRHNQFFGIQDDDDGDSSDDPEAVPGTPPRGDAEPSSPPRPSMMPVPETPEQPTPPPRAPGTAPVVVPESPYARRDPPPDPQRRQRTEASVPT
jgi:hypothetical protein